MRMQVVPNFPDYYFPYDVPGKRHGGRSVEPVPYAVGTELPEWRDRLVTRGTLMSLGAVTTLGEDFTLPDDALQSRAGAPRGRGRPHEGRGARSPCCSRACSSAGVDTLVETPARELVVSRRRGGRRSLRARRPPTCSSVPARAWCSRAAGSSGTRSSCASYIGYDVQPLSPGGNVGDGLVMAIEAGAELANMGSYWGQPAMFDPDITRDGELVPAVRVGAGRAELAHRQPAAASASPTRRCRTTTSRRRSACTTRRRPRSPTSHPAG